MQCEGGGLDNGLPPGLQVLVAVHEAVLWAGPQQGGANAFERDVKNTTAQSLLEGLQRPAEREMEEEACLPVGWAASPKHNSQAGFGSPAKAGWDENEDPDEFRIEAKWDAKQAQAAGAAADEAGFLLPAASPGGSRSLAASGELRERSAGPDGDLASAWAACEDLQRQLRRREEQLGYALDALDEAACGAAHGGGGGGTALVAAQQETAGQQLARFLKEQLALRDEELEAARRGAAEAAAQAAGAAGLAAALDGARAEAHALREENAALEAELAEARQLARESGCAAEEARRELAAARLQAEEEAGALRRQVWALEARVSLADYGATPGEGPTLRAGPRVHMPGSTVTANLYGALIRFASPDARRRGGGQHEPGRGDGVPLPRGGRPPRRGGRAGQPGVRHLWHPRRLAAPPSRAR